ncbi:MAG: methyltransferase domain-containing protein, partial [Patescibacteria group bacterium]|nr:methyltransferase domain-containing protein [Patescibacteria group bacterium]
MMHLHHTTKLINIDLLLDKIDLAQGMTVADFGCGPNGTFAFLAAEKVGNNGKVYALDIVKSHLTQIDREAGIHNKTNIKTIWSDIEKPIAAIPAESVDIVLIINTLHQTKKWDSVLKAAYQLTKKGGKITVVDWLKISNPMGPSTRLDKKDLIKAANQLGIQKVDEFMAGKYHFGLVFYK